MLEAISTLRELGIETVALLVLPATLAAAIGAFFGALVKAVFDRHVKRDIANLSSALDRIERQQAARMEDRSKAYGAIWKLTGAFNLFGPENVQTPEKFNELTAELSDWYFTHGQMLTQNARNQYFLIQEALMFCDVNSIQPTRPDRVDLYMNRDGKRAVERVNEMFREELEKAIASENSPKEPEITDNQKLSRLIEAGPDNSKKLEKLECLFKYLPDLVAFWKTTAQDTLGTPDNARYAWLVLQHLFTRFRTRLTVEMKTRHPDF